MKRTKLAYRVLQSLSLRVGCVVLCGALLGVWQVRAIMEKNTLENITTANRERAERESVVFDLARKNHELLRAEVLSQLAKKADPRKIARFDALLSRYPDGTIRNRREIFDGRVNAGVFIPAEHPITPEFKSFIVTLIELTELYGKVFRANFQDTYFTTPRNVMVIFWPEEPNWALEMKADFDMTKEEYVWVADAEHNPERRTVWTGLFYDKIASQWMSSGETPIYLNDRHIATIGHDVMLSELTERVTSMNQGGGSYSLILRSDGRLVAHPQKQSDLQVKEGKYNVSADSYLNALLSKLLSAGETARHPHTGDILVQSKIRGPDWLLVTVFPKEQIMAGALQALGFLAGLALLSLFAEMIFLYLVLEKEINRPLQDLALAADALREGRPSAVSFNHRTDELGKFAATFQAMADTITERDRLLQEHAESLEAKVKERTQELENQKVISVQQAKMASLGEMAGGVAHEINNPLATISLVTHHLQDLIEEPHIERELIKSNLEKVIRTTDRIAKIVRGLRTFSRSASKDPMLLTSLQSIVRETISLCGEKMRNHGVELRVQDGQETEINCRATEISQVLLNLLNNAYDAVEPLEEKWIEINIERAGSLARVRITDSGNGIPPEVITKLMQPFFTTKEVGKGTGLGLSIAKGIAEAHGGRLYVDTAEKNTCFVLELPVA